MILQEELNASAADKKASTHRKITSVGADDNQKEGDVKSSNQALVDLRPGDVTLQAEILRGLQRPIKILPTKLLYDRRGSELFDEITMLPEYYPTRTETAILKSNVDEIAMLLGERTMLVEYGSGSSTKTRILLDHLIDPAAYVPIDISAEHLSQAADQLRTDYSTLEILPVTADYREAIELPKSQVLPNRRVVFFPGSTIGNFQPDEALAFLRRIAQICGYNGGLLVGVDLKKDPAVLHQAYNDQRGVTAEFNLNILAHLNREFSTEFRLDQFRHYAYYNAQQGRIEMHLVNLADQIIQWQDQRINIRQGESIWTESSYKYTLEEFHELTAQAGFAPVKTWTDDEQLFSVHFLEVGN
ncbi:MAG: L-histidine N(alpha)-methyltransferase [Chloroflexota bacterium]